MRPDWAHPLAHDYQIRVVEFCLLEGDGKLELPGISVAKVGRSTYINLDMGLGKTLISLMIKKALDQPALVFAPIRAVHDTWPEQVDEWFPEFSYGVMHGKEKDWVYEQKYDFYFTNPESLKWFEFRRCRKYHPAKILFIDEGSMWKAHNSGRFKIMKRMRKLYDGQIYILSGTPNPQSYLNLWSQYFILDGGRTLETAYTRFRSRYFNQVDQNGFVFELKDGGAEAIQKLVAPRTIRLDAIDHIKMPALIENEIKLTMPPELHKQYKDFEKEYVLEIPELLIDEEAFNAASLSSKLRQFVQGFVYSGLGAERIATDIHQLKIDAVRSLIVEMDTPFMLAFEFKHEQEMLRNAFGDIPIIAGGTNPKYASEIFKEWNKGNISLMAVQPSAVNYALNLQKGPGHNIVWMALTWSLEKYIQLIKRIHRQGSKNPFVMVHHITIDKTVDRKVSKALRDRRDVQQAYNDYLRGLVKYG